MTTATFKVAAVVVVVGVLFVPIQGQQFREDGRCGPDYPADNGKPALCDDIPPFPTW